MTRLTHLRSSCNDTSGLFLFGDAGREVLRVLPDGRVYLRNREVGQDDEVYAALKIATLPTATERLPDPVPPAPDYYPDLPGPGNLPDTEDDDEPDDPLTVETKQCQASLT